MMLTSNLANSCMRATKLVIHGFTAPKLSFGAANWLLFDEQKYTDKYVKNFSITN
jgi:hypothetical protein